MVEARFNSDVVECLPLDPVAQVRSPPRAVGIFLHPVTGAAYGVLITEKVVERPCDHRY